MRRLQDDVKDKQSSRLLLLFIVSRVGIYDYMTMDPTGDRLVDKRLAKYTGKGRERWDQ